MRLRRPALLAAIAAVLLGLALLAHAADPDALWNIVSTQCLPNWRANGKPEPCRRIDADAGYALLKDIRGAYQYLLIPTRRVSGIESAELQAPEAPNYWQYAWEQRDLVEQALGHPLAADRLGLAVNSALGRSQNQLHIHIDCLRPDVHAALERLAANDEAWTPLELRGHRYRIRRLASLESDPFKQAAALAGADAMGQETLLLTAAPGGFYLLEHRAEPLRGDFGAAEELLDHDCALAGG